MKKKFFVFLSIIIVLSLSGCATTSQGKDVDTQSSTTDTKESQTVSSTTHKEESLKTQASAVLSTAAQTVDSSVAKEVESIDLTGIFYTVTDDIAKVKLLSGNRWEIAYPTLDGDVTASFETNWKTSGHIKQSKTPMKKSDEYSGFNILIEYLSDIDIKLTMEDGNPAHKMVFTREKPTEDKKYEVILQGDLSPFVGELSNDDFNKAIAESGFTLGGYSPDDYYNSRTTVFPSITENGYWNGFTSHGIYEVKVSDLPKKVDGYYEVHVYGVNTGANNGEITFFLVPPQVKGPDGTLSDERRVFQVLFNGEMQMNPYQKDEWWKEYQSQ